MLRIKNAGAIAIALTTLLFVAGVASAKSYTVSGAWISQKGTYFRIPAHAFPFVPEPRPIKGAAQIDSVGTAVVIPTGFWDSQYSSLNPVNTDEVVQLGTDWSFDGPAVGVMSQGTALLAAQTLTAAHPTHKNANFKYCPGASNNPACLNNLAGGASGTKAGRIQYTAGSNSFGGTMQYILSGIGTIVNSIGTIGGEDRWAHNNLAGDLGNPQAMGGSYANTAFVSLGAGPASTGAVCGGLSCGPFANGVITVPGNITGIGPPSGQTSTGMPMTTGTVTVSIPQSKNSIGNGLFGPMTLVGKGSDSRNAGGYGNISLVAGALSHRQVGWITPNMEFVTLSFSMGNPSQADIPAMSPMGLVAGAVLFVLSFGYVMRKRL
jgi:hypothetical protein